MHAHGATDVVEHRAYDVIVRVTHPHVRVRHVAGLDGLRRRTGWRQVHVEHGTAVAGLDLVETRVAGDVTVLLGAQRHDAGGVPARRPAGQVPVHDRGRPLPVDIDVVCRRVEVPRADARWAGTDL